MATSLSTSSPIPSRISTPLSRDNPATEPPLLAKALREQHKIPPAVHQLSIPVKDSHGGQVSGFLHLPSNNETSEGSGHASTAAILLSGAGGGISGPASMYLALGNKLPALHARIPVLRLDYRYPARTAPCVADTIAAINFLEEHSAIERVVLAGWSFGGAPVFTVAGRDERVAGAVLVAPQTADAMQGARDCGRRKVPVLLMHGTGDRTLSPKCSESLYAAWWSKAPTDTDDDACQLVLFDNDDHALSRNARVAEEQAAQFVVSCAEERVEDGEAEFVAEEVISGKDRVDLMRAGKDLRGKESVE